MDETEMLPHCINCIEKQLYRNFHVVICINQPEDCWDIPEKKNICLNNKKIFDFLIKKNSEHITIIDKTSKGNGWQGNKKGVGWARKTIMDYISKKANNNDIILSLDADTVFSEKYFSSIIDIFSKNQNAAALSNPYYHRLTGSEAEDKAILHYEIYMRNYAINLMNINSPYAFTALGSAIAVTVSAYKAIGGMTPKLSGEDFYFLQKLKKYGNIIIHNSEKVFPAARFSDRVFFGTGPAMIKGNQGDWSSYPIYHNSLFSDIKKTYDAFPDLLTKSFETPLTNFIKEIFKKEDIWEPLRKNFNSEKQFVRACHEKIDGLRILQYCKQTQSQLDISDEQCLKENYSKLFSSIKPIENPNDFDNFDFSNSSVEQLNRIRNYLANIEEILQERINVL